MKKLLLLFIFHTSLFTLQAFSQRNLTEYCQQIDEAIAHSQDYIAAREQKIGQARHALTLETTPRGKYQQNYQLYELYKPFVSDSAMYFLRQCVSLADGMDDPSSAVRCRSLLAIRCSNIGMYDEALNILDSINSQFLILNSQLDTLSLGTYYEAYIISFPCTTINGCCCYETFICKLFHN